MTTNNHQRQVNMFRSIRCFAFVALFVSLLPLAAGLAQTAGGSGEYREVKDARGRQLQARVLGVEGDSVTLERRDGRKFTVDISVLSQADQEYIRGLVKPLGSVGPQYSACPESGLGDLKIPQNRVPIWQPGVEGGIPDTSTWAIIEANDAPYNVVGDGSTTVGPAIQRALDDAASAAATGRSTKVHLRAGKHVIGYGNKITFGSNTLLYGDGPKSTRVIYFVQNGGKHTIRTTVLLGSRYAIHHYPKASAVRLAATAPRGSQTVTLSASPEVAVGDWVLIAETGKDPAMFENLNGRADAELISHIAKVTAITGMQVAVDRPLRIDIRKEQGGQLRKIEMLENAGISDLALDGHPENAIGGPIAFHYAANCWMKDVEITRPYNWFVHVENSARNTIAHGRLVGPSIKSEQTWNYGITAFMGAQDNLITDNIVEFMYQALLIQQGASGNVFSYNYFPNTRWLPGQLQWGDIVLHGGWPHENLFEGNDLQGSGRHDAFWGSNGHRNTWYRNRMDDGTGWDRGEGAHGFIYAADRKEPHDDFMNLMLNVVNIMVTRTGHTPLDTKDNGAYDAGADNLHLWIERNLATDDSGKTGIKVAPHATTVSVGNHLGTRAPDSWAGLQFPASLYRTGQPDWWPASKPWPAIGADVDMHGGAKTTLPAQDRFEDSANGL